ncbi:MAG TPA: hypothetical protein EYP24_04200 [bacterium (Candidatus Stahlbacteria)]|nr:hypothetical protein [Candidatus Stahlbacteria bacterium]
MVWLLIILSIGPKSLIEVNTDRVYLPILIEHGFELDGYTDGIAKGLIDYDKIDDLIASGFKVKLLYKDYRDATRWVLELEDFGYYHSYTEMCAALESLARDYPSIARMETLGFSVQNRAIVALKVTDNPGVEEPEPTFIFDGDIHGNEIIGGEVVLAQAKKLCYDYGSDTLITRLVDEGETWLVPILNPDGMVAGSRYNANWVDLNRDFGYQWGATGNSPSPFSQPETKVRRDLLLNNYSLNSVTFHSGTKLYIYPWGFTGRIATPDSARMAYIAQRYVQFFPVPYGQIARILYSVYGGSTDFFYGCFGDLAPAVELSNYYAPPPSQIDTICNMNVRGMVELMRVSQFGIRGIVTDSLTGDPLPARIEVLGEGWQVYTDPLVGDYYRFLLQGTYTVTARANGYYDKTVTNVAVPNNGYKVVNFELVPEDGQIYGGYAVPSCRTRRTPTNQDIYFTLKCLGKRDGKSLTLGSGGWIIIDMGPNSPIKDRLGDDLTVVVTSSGQTYQVEVADSLDGTFLSIGTGNTTQGFDIQPSGLTQARYVRIKALGTPSIDAVESQMPSGVSEPEAIHKPSFTLIRNPSDRIRFMVNGIDRVKMHIFSCDGRLIESKEVRAGPYRSDPLPSGVYFLKIEGKNFSKVEKCLIIRR